MDKDAFISNIVPLQNGWYRLALGFVKSDAVAKDVVQDVALKVWQHRARWDEIENMKAWTMKIVRNRCLDVMKKQTHMVLSLSSSFNEVSSEQTPYESLESMDVNANLDEMINTLPEPQCQVIKLREIEGYSYKEIAEILDISMDHVKVAIHRARKKLRVLIEKRKII